MWIAAAAIGSVDSWNRLRKKELGNSSKGYSQVFFERFEADAAHVFNLSDSAVGLTKLNADLVHACRHAGVMEVRLAEVWWSHVKAKHNAYLSLDDFLMCIVRIDTEPVEAARIEP